MEKPAGDVGKGWGLSHFKIKVTKAAGLWRKRWNNNEYWGGSTDDPKLDFFDVGNAYFFFIFSRFVLNAKHFT